MRRADVLAVVSLLALGLAYQLILLQDGIGLIDEGHLANGARRVAGGEVLYRDVYTVYPPASFYVVGWLFDLCGKSLIVARAFHVVFTLVLAVLTYGASRRLMEPPFAFLAGALVAATGWAVIAEGCHYAYLYGAIPMAALLVLARADEQGRLERGPLVAVGALAGLALAFRLEPFVGLALAGGVVVFVRAGFGREAVAKLSWLVAGTLLVVVPIGLYFAFEGAFGALFEAVFWTSFGQYLQGGEFNLPMPELEWIPSEWSRRGLRRWFIGWEFRVPVLLYLFALFEAGRALIRRARSDGREAVSATVLMRLSLALFGAVLYLRATGRSDYYHLAPILFPAYILGCDGLARLGRRVAAPGWLALPLVGTILAASLFIHQFDRAAERALARRAYAPLVAGGPYLDPNDRIDELVAELRARTDAGEPIVVLPWHPIVYFLADRPNPTRFDWLFPGYLKTEAEVDAFIASIERSSVRIVAYSPISIDGQDDRSLAAFAPAIHRYLSTHFRRVKREGRFLILERQRPPRAALSPAAAEPRSEATN